MPFIPHTEAEVRRMLEVIGVRHLDALFDEIPAALRAPPPQGVPEATGDGGPAHRPAAGGPGPPTGLFLGAGCYEHHIPAAVWQIAARGEFYSAYTPYQAEASQGTLQVIYEFQSMLSALTGLAVSNASLYDGATATAEAALMAVRQRRRDAAHRVLVPHTLHPLYRRVLSTLLAPQGIELTLLDYDPDQGHLPEHALEGERRLRRPAVAAAQFPRGAGAGGHPHPRRPGPRCAGDRGGQPHCPGPAGTAR